MVGHFLGKETAVPRTSVKLWRWFTLTDSQAMAKSTFLTSWIKLEAADTEDHSRIIMIMKERITMTTTFSTTCKNLLFLFLSEKQPEQKVISCVAPYFSLQESWAFLWKRASRFSTWPPLSVQQICALQPGLSLQVRLRLLRRWWLAILSQHWTPSILSV